MVGEIESSCVALLVGQLELVLVATYGKLIVS